MIDLSEVGAFPGPAGPAGPNVRFGIYLPGLDPAAYAMRVNVIHYIDRFVPHIQPVGFELAPVPGHPLGLWQTVATIGPRPGSNFGQPGRYLYRYQLLTRATAGQQARVVLRWVTDPFARTTDEVGMLSAFDTHSDGAGVAWTDHDWRVPDVNDLVVYEVQVEEFNDTFAGLAARLPYVAGLGVNCLELMPVTSLKLNFDWGYGPLHYFAPNERWGGAKALKELVNAAHALGIAVILDVVYQHVDPSFPYALIYTQVGQQSPMIGAQGLFGPEIDFQREFAREYVRAVNRYWLEEYHVDGFRYDEVTDLYQSPTDPGYAALVYETYNLSLTMPRFTSSGRGLPGEYSHIIQCAEALWRARDVLNGTYTNCAWTNDLMDKTQSMAAGSYVDDAFALTLDATFSGYPLTKTVDDSAGQPVEMPVSPFQYLESHDHSPLLAYLAGQLQGAVLADRSLWFKLQPYIVALYTCQGVPMLWQGQEFADNSVLPDSGDARIHYRRDVHWEYFYDDFGSPLVRLHRNLGALRRTIPSLRSRESYYYNLDSRSAQGLIAYERRLAGQSPVVVVLNFADQAGQLSVPCSEAGVYREMVDADVRQTPYEISVVQAGERMNVEVPSNYGFVFVEHAALS